MARPFVAALEVFQSLVELADDDPAAEEAPTPAENIEALISAGAEEGLIHEDDRKLLQSVMEFGDKVVREVMTPRPNIVAIPADATLGAGQTGVEFLFVSPGRPPAARQRRAFRR